ncbi:MAG: DUF4846 domain-containing protein [Calditrichaceae bacterium]|nr:DUF4846 domain-containing protein [Calditrichaceae bacterium]MBN2709468.1 DUF4846 domain-containing protein [Calditrichaceae bacterium]
MKPIGVFFITILLAFGGEAEQAATINPKNSIPDSLNKRKTYEIIHPEGRIIQTRFLPPYGFQRTKHRDSSFAEYLRQLPVKPHNAKVKLYNGRLKPNQNTCHAVVDLDIGNKNLHQCADAVIRLRAEYLWKHKQYGKIHFNFTNGFRVDYTEWMNGKRIIVKDNISYWIQSSLPSNTYADFWNYLETIFSYAGTLSLSKEFKTVKLKDLEIGDIFIQGGMPGHAIMVVDMSENTANGKKVFLLAQSYMPAQEIHILKNPNDDMMSPWYSIDFEYELVTPEWIFYKSDLKRFEE